MKLLFDLRMVQNKLLSKYLAEPKKHLNWMLEEIIKEKEGVFEGKYQTPTNVSMRSKEKVLIDKENNAYLITFMVLEEDWENLKDVVDFTIESAEIAP